MKKKIIIITIEAIASVLILAYLWDKNISVLDNIALLLPMIFIFGLMYLFIKG